MYTTTIHVLVDYVIQLHMQYIATHDGFDYCNIISVTDKVVNL